MSGYMFLSIDVIDVVTDLFLLRCVPTYIRSDNRQAFVAAAVRKWIGAVGAKTAYSEPSPPWQNADLESFMARLRSERHNDNNFCRRKEIQIIIEQRHQHYNRRRLLSTLAYSPPAPKALMPLPNRPDMN